MPKKGRDGKFLWIVHVCASWIKWHNGKQIYFFKNLLRCLSLISIIYSYVFCEYTCLTVMSYDRYLSICKPLEYHSIMKFQKGLKLLILTWLFSILESAVGLLFTAQLPLCGNVIDKLYCSNWEVVQLSCTDVTVNNLYGYFLYILSCISSCFRHSVIYSNYQSFFKVKDTVGKIHADMSFSFNSTHELYYCPALWCHVCWLWQKSETASSAQHLRYWVFLLCLFF